MFLRKLTVIVLPLLMLLGICLLIPLISGMSLFFGSLLLGALLGVLLALLWVGAKAVTERRGGRP